MATTIRCEFFDDEAAAVAAAVSLVLNASKQDHVGSQDYKRALTDAFASMREQFLEQHFDAVAYCRARTQASA